ncbi:MAG: thiol oxidoreductase [Gammaproteobacteria bacterium]|nr:thiol oxidoreductase [Gammaproteobacteria bacterium]
MHRRRPEPLLNATARRTLFSLLALMSLAAMAREPLPGGATTNTTRLGMHAYSQAVANLPRAAGLDFTLGRAFFERLWVAAPASTEAADGLGPLYNARACSQCHPRHGRGNPFRDDDAAGLALVAHLALPDGEPDPLYGRQLQTAAIAGHAAEGRLDITHHDMPITLSDGEVIRLRAPEYRIGEPAYGEPDAGTGISPRLASPLIGLGLLELIPETEMRAQADPDDADGDGISGRVNTVWSPARQAMAVGRFGWKAGQASIDEQNQAALRNDIGLSSPLHPDGAGDCTARQPDCRAAPNGNSPRYDKLEAHAVVTDLLRDYVRNLAPPARPADIDTRDGERLFTDIGCATCHRPHWRTADAPDRPHLGGQDIWPYTDLLLHDMGEALADHRPDGDADGNEWRTPPLWGIGRSRTVSGHDRFLHDGRAHGLLEAVLWHGGEATAARDRVIAMSAPQRRQLIRFLEFL